MARVSSMKGVFVAAGLVGLGSILSFAAPAKANTVLFTTQDDFTAANWNGGSSPTGAFDSDLSTTNGAGNTVNPGAAGTAGALMIPGFGRTSPGFNFIAEASEGSNSTFLSAIDPGSSGNNSVAYSGTLYMTYTIPTPGAGTFYQLGINLQYGADGYYQPFFGTTVSDGTIGGQTTVTATIPYTINAGQFNGFGFGVFANTDYSQTTPIFVDDIEVAVPEPVSMSLLGLSGLALLGRRRK